MKNTKVCPKCQSDDIIRIEGYSGPHGTGNNIILSKAIFNSVFYSSVNVHRYICCYCGYSEEWIDKEDIDRVKNSRRAKK